MHVRKYLVRSLTSKDTVITMVLGSQSLEPESRFRLALKRLIGATTEEETKEAIMDLEESLRLILEKRDREWSALLQEKGAGAPSYPQDMKGFAAELAREAAAAVEAKIDSKISQIRLPATEGPPQIIPSSSESGQRLDTIEEKIEHLREIVKGELQPETKETLKKEIRTSIEGHMSADDELARMIAELVQELRGQLLAELKTELTEEVKAAIKDEIKNELRKELL
ncbi:MAG: hypothetical protein HYS81_02830 [Candidatus Aenigmatarchaeota archaeon]|nr:MAG: hypothetical protein HYS81_02830 [Candidatus Aenigmarchaeota archaeon]